MYGAFMVVGWLASRKVREGTAADLIVAGRAMPLWVAALTMTATWVDGGYLLGTTEGAYKNSIQLGIQGGLCFGISLILGGIFFAGIMRRFGFTTLIDPLEARFGKRWAAVLFLPALAGELFWSAELLVAVGSTFGVLLGMKLTTAILLSAVVTTAYTVLGGMWSVAYTDIFQLALVAIGLAAALPYVLAGAGGLHHAWDVYVAARPEGGGMIPPWQPHTALWNRASVIGWWDTSVMLMFGGIPWNCYLAASCRAGPRGVRAGHVGAGGRADDRVHGAAAADGRLGVRVSVAGRRRRAPGRDAGRDDAAAVPARGPAGDRPARPGGDRRRGELELQLVDPVGGIDVELELREAPDVAVGVGGPDEARHPPVRFCLFGALAAGLALKVQSVQALWFFTSDLVFVLLFPLLPFALLRPEGQPHCSIDGLRLWCRSS